MFNKKIFLVICLVIMNIVFFFIVVMEKIRNADEQILSEEQKQRIFIDFLN